MSQVLTAQDFVSHVGKMFTPKGQHRVLTLVSVDTVGWPGEDGMLREPFILILRGPPGDVLPEALYDVAVRDGPDLELYIIPIHTAARDRQDYQVAFN
jgi:hypothetical protein